MGWCNTHVVWTDGECGDCLAMESERKAKALRETLERAETQRQVAVPDVDPYEEPLNPWWPATDADCGPAVQAAIGAAAGTLRASAKLPGSMVAPEPLRLADFMPVDYEERPDRYRGCWIDGYDLDDAAAMALVKRPGTVCTLRSFTLGSYRSIEATDVERVAKQNEISLRDAAGALAGSAWQELVGEEPVCQHHPQCLAPAASVAEQSQHHLVCLCGTWTPMDPDSKRETCSSDSCRMTWTCDASGGWSPRSCPIAALKAAGWTLDEVNRAVLSGEVKP
jgi:hypothetical protein